MIVIELADLAATHALGARIAAMAQPGDVIALEGDLGAGKTTLARAILAGLGHSGEVPSPTFPIIELYDPPGVRLPVVHADFYRLERPEHAAELGLDDYREGALLIAEWPARAGGFAHEPGYLGIRMETREKARLALVVPGPLWQNRGSWT